MLITDHTALTAGLAAEQKNSRHQVAGGEGKLQTQEKRNGLSLKTTSVLMMIISLIITVILVITAVMTVRSFRSMKESTHD